MLVDLTMLKDVLAQGLQVVIGIKVYSSFESDTVSQTGVVPFPDVQTEELLGSHAVLVVGYDNTNQWAIVRNSWGPNWGIKDIFIYLINIGLKTLLRICGSVNKFKLI